LPKVPKTLFCPDFWNGNGSNPKNCTVPYDIRSNPTPKTLYRNLSRKCSDIICALSNIKMMKQKYANSPVFLDQLP
jgi:hypothetical protein